MLTTDPAWSPMYQDIELVSYCPIWHSADALFASIRASSCNPFEAHALLHFTRMSIGFILETMQRCTMHSLHRVSQSWTPYPWALQASQYIFSWDLKHIIHNHLTIMSIFTQGTLCSCFASMYLLAKGIEDLEKWNHGHLHTTSSIKIFALISLHHDLKAVKVHLNIVLQEWAYSIIVSPEVTYEHRWKPVQDKARCCPHLSDCTTCA